MILHLHWSMGDHACYTGVPEAYYNHFGQKLGLISNEKYKDLWKNNPFVDLNPDPGDKTYLMRIEQIGEKTEWLMYRPQRIFQEMTGRLVPREHVQPILYREKNTVKKRIVVCDEAGWSSRRGYSYFDLLVQELNDLGYETCLIRNLGYGPKQITCASKELSLSLDGTIEFMSTADLYIGYDSGLAHLAAGFDIPYIIFCAATPPIVVCHDACVLAIEVCDHCCCDRCVRGCLERCENCNKDIIEEVKKCMDCSPNKIALL